MHKSAKLIAALMALLAILSIAAALFLIFMVKPKTKTRTMSDVIAIPQKLRAPIPPRMRHLDIDPRGYAIPWLVWRDSNGKAHFTINDEPRREIALRRDLCPVCGTKLFRGRWFVGGPGSAFDPDGAFIDTPMHAECKDYSMTVCPYLTVQHYDRRIDDRTVDALEKGVIAIDPTLDPTRPKLFVALMAIGQRRVREGGLPNYVIPKRPYARIEFWLRGKIISEAEAMPLLSNDLRGHYRACLREGK